MALPTQPIISPASSTFSEPLVCDIRIPSGYEFGDRIYYSIDGSAVTTSSDYIVGARLSTLLIPAGANRTIKAASYRYPDGFSATTTVNLTYVNLNQSPVFRPLQDSDLGEYLQNTEGAIRILVDDDKLPNNNLTFTITSGTLPGGLDINSRSGLISGLITDNVGDYTFTVNCNDGDKDVSRVFTMSVVANSYSAPLSSPYQTLNTTDLDSRVNLRHRILQQLDSTTARVLITWSKLGIVDCANTLVHTLEIRKNSITTAEFPIRFTEAEAYQNRYSYVIDNYDLTARYSITLSINYLYTKTLVVDALVPPKPKIGSIQENLTRGKVTTSIAGIGVKVLTCQLDLLKDVKNIFIHKDSGRALQSAVLPLAYVRSVPISVTIPTDCTAYTSAVINGKSYMGPTQDQVDSIVNDRTRVLAHVTYTDLSNNFLEETNAQIIKYTPAHLVYSVTSSDFLNPLVHNEPAFLYKTDNDSKFYRYRSKTTLLPQQAVTTNTSPRQKWIDLLDVDGNSDGTFVLPIPGSFTLDTTTAEIRLAVMNSRGDYTSFTIDPVTSANLATELEAMYPGVKFMRDFISHIDTVVDAGSWYTYSVNIELWDGSHMTVLRRSACYETINDAALLGAKITLDSLRVPTIGSSALTEYDFQSGISRNMKAQLSPRSADLRDYEANKLAEQMCGCTWAEVCDV